MKNSYLLYVGIICFIGFSSCKNDTATVKQQEQPEQTQQEIIEKQPTVTNQIIEYEFKKEDTKDLKLEDNIITGKKWKDKNGENLLVLTALDLREVDKEKSIQEIFGYHFVKKGDTYQQLWRVYDFMQAESWMDITAQHLPKSLALTDFDNNGIAETMFMYYLFAGTDVSPGTVKLIMHEGAKKYALRGENRIDYAGVSEGGSYKVDKAFNDAPKSFLKGAKVHWDKYAVIRYE